MVRTQSTERKLSAAQHFATFRLGLLELALDVRYVREAIDSPQLVSSIPLVPDYCKGVFELRGQIIPLLSLEKLLGAKSGGETGKTMIVTFQNCVVGLECSATGTISQFPDEECTHVEIQAGAEQVVDRIASYKESGEERFVQLISPEHLFRLHNIPRLVEAFSDEAVDAMGHIRVFDRGERERLVSFRLSDSLFAISVLDIIEIQEAGVILPASVCLEDYYSGMIEVRGALLPLVSLHTLLQIEGETPGNKSEGKVLIISGESQDFGVLVDDIHEILHVSSKDRLPIPLLSRASQSSVFDSLIRTKGSTVLTIDVAQFVAEFALERFFDNFKKTVPEEDRRGGIATTTPRIGHGKGSNTLLDNPLLLFQSRQLFACDISEVTELVPYPVEVSQVPGQEANLFGVLCLRGDAVPVYDLHHFLWQEPFHQKSGIIVIVEVDGGCYGVLVDGVEEILRLKGKEVTRLPSMMSQTTSDHANRLVTEVFGLPREGERFQPVSIVSLQKVVRALLGREQAFVGAVGEALETATEQVLASLNQLAQP